VSAAGERAQGRPSDRDRFLRIDDVIATTALSRRTIYRMIREGEFPAQHRLSKRAVGWWQGAVDDWLQSRLNPPGKA